MRLAACSILAVFLFTGCALFRPNHPATTSGSDTTTTNTAARTNDQARAPIVTPDTAQSGSVLQVNVSARFAVLNFPVGSMPPVGRRLYVYRAGLKVGELKVTGPQRDDNTVADIVNGEAQAGDEIRTK